MPESQALLKPARTAAMNLQAVSISADTAPAALRSIQRGISWAMIAVAIRCGEPVSSRRPATTALPRDIIPRHRARRRARLMADITMMDTAMVVL